MCLRADSSLRAQPVIRLSADIFRTARSHPPGPGLAVAAGLQGCGRQALRWEHSSDQAVCASVLYLWAQTLGC